MLGLSVSQPKKATWYELEDSIEYRVFAPKDLLYVVNVGLQTEST